MASDSRNIQVFVRCRPINDKERREHAQGAAILRFPRAPVDEHDLISTGPGVGRAIALPMGVTTQSALTTSRTYTFDRVFAPTVDQDTVFRSVMLPIFDQVLAGFPCTVFAYGQTSSGKTHTMEGDLDLDADGQLSPHAGLIPRTLTRLFDMLEPSRGDQVSISCLEIYNEVLRDLLAADGATCDLTLYEDKRTANVIVQGITDHIVTSPVDALAHLQRASERRSIAATLMNQHSSRSHCVVTVTVRTVAADTHLTRVGKLHLVDLAGSESLGRTGTGAATQTREAGAINQSLLALGRVMTTLATKPGKHVPYRESKLTHLLKPALGGNSRTCMIATVSPARSNFEETQSTLEYAHRAKNIKNKPKVSTEHGGVPRRGGSALSMVSFAGENDAAAYGVPAAPDAEQRALHETIAQQRARIEQLQRDKAHLEAQLLQHQQMQLKVMESHRVALTAAHNQALEHKQAGARFRERVREDERVLRVVSQRETKLRAVIGQLVESVEGFDRDMDEAWEAARRIATGARQVVKDAVDAEWTPSLADLKADLTRLDEAHGSIGAALGDRLDALTGSLSQSIDRAHTQFDDVARQLNGEFEQLANQIGTLPPDSSTAAMEQLAKLREHVTAALAGMAVRASADQTETHTQLCKFLDSQAQEHDAFVASVVSTLSSLHDHFAGHAGHVRNLGTEVARFADTVRPQLSTVATDLRDRHALEQDSTARAGDELVRELSGAVSALLYRQLAVHDETVRAVTADLTTAVVSFGAWDARIAPVVQEMRAGLDDAAARVTGTAVLDQLAHRRDHVATWSSTMTERLSAGPPASVETIAQTVDAGLGQCDGTLSRIDRLLAEHGSGMKLGDGGLQSVSGEIRRAMDELAEESNKRRAAVEEHFGVVNEAKIALCDMVSAHQDAESAARSLSTHAPPDPLPIPHFPDLSRLSPLTVPAWEDVLATLPPLPSTTDPRTAIQPIDTTLPPIPSCMLDPADTVPLPQEEPADATADDDLPVHEATPPPDPPGEFEFPYEVPEPEPGAPAVVRKRKLGRDRSPSPAGSQSPARNVVATPKRQRMR
ncbi:kinesin motor protein cin8 [Allomyces javanicus]|nr:kinesin motor protein cin8 [Allomyces javanicus]